MDIQYVNSHGESLSVPYLTMNGSMTHLIMPI